MHELVNYFTLLSRCSTDLLGSLPIARDPQPLEYALGILAPALEAHREREIAGLRQIPRPKPLHREASAAAVPTGLNTVGMLSDRLTILVIKEWCLRNKTNANPAKADELFGTQTMDIIGALALAQPGSSALNSKITSIKSGAAASDWAEAFWGILTTNLLLWESQEMLYIKDISKAPCEELRAYIDWFSMGNLQRNRYIELCENLYWQSD